MILQDVVWGIAVTGIALVALIFVYIISQAGKPADEAATRKSAQTANTLRVWLFWILMAGFLGGSWATLHQFPVARQQGPLDAAQVVEVTGHMWYWDMQPASVKAGSAVAFRVTSADVNHGFALYSPDGHIVTQTQAMPGYTNTLLYTFATPGTYTVRCLEYCGIGHAPMRGTLEVTSPTGGQ